MKRIALKFATVLCMLSLVTAHTASSLCLIILMGEPEMPKSLYARD